MLPGGIFVLKTTTYIPVLVRYAGANRYNRWVVQLIPVAIIYVHTVNRQNPLIPNILRNRTSTGTVPGTCTVQELKGVCIFYVCLLFAPLKGR